MGTQPPQQPRASSSASRRRQRSTRITVSVALVALAGVLVLGAAVVGAAWLWTTAAVVALVLGGAATRIMHSELVQTRRAAARDRARQAKEYAALTEARAAESAAFADSMRERIDEREQAISSLEEALATAQQHALEQTRKLNGEARRADLAERDHADTRHDLDAAEGRAAEAIVRVAELEAEIDVLRTELADWKAGRGAASRTA
jgi:hypothetical protein